VSGAAHGQALLFMLLSMIAHLHAAAATGRRRTTLEALSAIGYAAAVLSQPAALGLAGVVVAFDAWRARVRGVHVPFRTVLRGAAPHLAVAAAAVVATALVAFLSPVAVHRPVSLAEFGVVPRAAQAFYVLAWFAWRPFVPARLSPVYPDLVAFDAWALPFVASALGVAGFVLVAWRQRQRWPALWALTVSYVLLLAPVLGWTDHPHYPNDRYSTAAALVGSVAVAGFIASARPAWRGVAAAVAAGLLVVVLVPWTVRQCAIWRNSEALFRHVLATLGDDPSRGAVQWRLGIHRRLGVELEGERRLPEAAEQYVRALAIDPRHPVASAGLLRLCADGGRRSRQEALGCYRRALGVGPDAIAARWKSDPALGACVRRCTGETSGPDGCGGVCGLEPAP
jgi:protein O-mannosyl-transferase